jgi:hypothetical protein
MPNLADLPDIAHIGAVGGLFVQRQLPITSMLWWHVRWDAVLRAGSVLNTGVAHLPGHARTQGDRVRFDPGAACEVEKTDKCVAHASASSAGDKAARLPARETLPTVTVKRRCSAEFLEDPHGNEPPKGKVCDVRYPAPDCRV